MAQEAQEITISAAAGPRVHVREPHNTSTAARNESSRHPGASAAEIRTFCKQGEGNLIALYTMYCAQLSEERR